jgi:serine protease Do
MFNNLTRVQKILTCCALLSVALLIGIYLGIYLGKKIMDLRGLRTTDANEIRLLPTPLLKPNLKAKRSQHPLGEDTIADIAAEAAPAVVNIGIYTKNFRPMGSGSGLIIRPAGYIVTNNHLIRPNTEIKVTLNDQRAFKAKLVGRDPFTDLAVLKIECAYALVVPFANNAAEAIRPGDWAIAIGNPLGYDHTVTLGIISAIHRSLADLNAHVELIQTDAAINPGNSGGPLLNIHGQVIGLTSAIRNGAQNIGFAIPVDVVEQVSNLLIKDGTITRPYLGVFMKDFDNRIISNPNLPANTQGVLALSVVPNGPAQSAGIFAGDFIESFAGVPVTRAQEIRNIAQKHKPGDTIELSILHSGKSQIKRLTIGNYPQERNTP